MEHTMGSGGGSVSRCVIATAILIAYLGTVPTGVADWPQYQRDAAHTGSWADENRSFPPRTSLGVTVASPIVPLGDGLVLMDADGDVHHFRANATAARWTFERGGFDETAVVANGTVYVGAVDGRPVTEESRGTLHALGADGGERWRVDGDGPVVSAPAVRNGTVYAGVGDALVALDASTGRRLWTVPTGATTGKVVAAEGGVYAAAAPLAAAREAVLGGSSPRHLGRLVAVAPTGERRWTANVTPTGHPAVTAERVYVGTVGGDLVALARDDGRRLWSRSVGGVPSTPVLHRDAVHVGTAEGRLVAVDAEDGAVRWRHDLPAAVHPPAVAGATVYAASRSGHVGAFAGDDGGVRWNATLDGTVRAAPTVAGEAVLVAADDTVYALDGPPTATAGSGAAVAGAAPLDGGRSDGGDDDTSDGALEATAADDRSDGGANASNASNASPRNASTLGGGGNGTEEAGSAGTGAERYSDVSIVLPLLAGLVALGVLLAGVGFR